MLVEKAPAFFGQENRSIVYRMAIHQTFNTGIFPYRQTRAIRPPDIDDFAIYMRLGSYPS
jgi:hypothetical protein